MRFGRIVPCIVMSALVVVGTRPAQAQKDALNTTIARLDNQCWETARAIWNWSEPGYQETQSSAALAKMLEDAGFQVHRGVAEIPTAFTATYGKGAPVIGILGEYDALPGLSQAAVPYREPRADTNWGHACGHHLFGVASAAAAIAIAEQIQAGKLKGTVRFYGCPAEEGGAGKVFMVQAGLFQDCDAVLHWHPASRNAAGDRSSMARIAAKFRFFGKAAHAAGAPEEGRSALDAVELMNHASELMREHTPDFTRVHHVVTSGGEAPNVVPEFAEVYYYVRHMESKIVADVYRRLVLCAEAGALATETRLEIKNEGGIKEILPNNVLNQVVLENLQALNDLSYTAEEKEFAARIQPTLAKPEPVDNVSEVKDVSGEVGKGSTDVGDVSWVVPTSGFSTACWVPGTPGHSWQAVAAGGTSIGRKGMNLAARVLAATAWDLFTTPKLIDSAKAELQRRTGEQAYESLMQPGQKPPLDYRNAPR